MPEINQSINSLGRGFAAFLTPPPEDVIRFTVGQPDFRTPEPVVDAAKLALDSGLHGYTRSQGSIELCKAVANHLQKYDISYSHEDVLIAPGCKQALLYAMMVCLNPEDEVLLLAPAWPSYDAMLKLVHAKPVHVKVHRHDYHPDFEAIEQAITPKTKAIILNSPNNPTGAVYFPDEIKRIVEIAQRHDLWILDDMIYADLVYSDHPYLSPASLPQGKSRTITIGGWSKIWAMTGWRLGWIAGPEVVMKGVKTCQANSASHVPTFLMPPAEIALSLVEEPKQMAQDFENRRRVFHELLREIPGLQAPMPEGAFYILVDVSETGMDDITFANRLLEEGRVQVIPGSLMPHGENLVRMSYATSIENIKEGCLRIREWLESIMH